jgi:hypothetical protein
VEECYRCNESIGIAKRPCIRLAILHELKDAVDSIEGQEDILDNTPPRNVTMSIYVNNQCVARLTEKRRNLNGPVTATDGD